MRLLLDTHIFLWFITGDARLPPEMRAAIVAPDNDVFLSVVSLWEIIIKYQLRKLPLPEPPATYIPRQRMRHRVAELDLDGGAVSRLADLPPLHKDPCDRMLICQAVERRARLATVDPAVRAYGLNLFD